jgi:hypothetical protein
MLHRFIYMIAVNRIALWLLVVVRCNGSKQRNTRFHYLCGNMSLYLFPRNINFGKKLTGIVMLLVVRLPRTCEHFWHHMIDINMSIRFSFGSRRGPGRPFKIPRPYCDSKTSRTCQHSERVSKALINLSSPWSRRLQKESGFSIKSPRLLLSGSCKKCPR